MEARRSSYGGYGVQLSVELSGRMPRNVERKHDNKPHYINNSYCTQNSKGPDGTHTRVTLHARVEGTKSDVVGRSEKW